MVKKQNYGKVLEQVGFLKIRNIPQFEGVGKKRRTKTSTIGIFHEKKLIKDGFKNTLEALTYINENAPSIQKNS